MGYELRGTKGTNVRVRHGEWECLLMKAIYFDWKPMGAVRKLSWPPEESDPWLLHHHEIDDAFDEGNEKRTILRSYCESKGLSVRPEDARHFSAALMEFQKHCAELRSGLSLPDWVVESILTHGIDDIELRDGIIDPLIDLNKAFEEVTNSLCNLDDPDEVYRMSRRERELIIKKVYGPYHDTISKIIGMCAEGGFQIF